MSNNVKLLIAALVLGGLAWFAYNGNVSFKSYLHPKKEQQKEYKSPYGPQQPPKEWVKEWENEREKLNQ